MKKFLILITVISLVMVACGKKDENAENKKSFTPAEKQEILTKAKAIFTGPLPDKMPGSENDTPELIKLGDKLYHETKLSLNNNQSCNTCHDVKKGGVDNKALSDGSVTGKIGTRNANTVLNAGFQFAQFWDYRSPDLVDQAKGPILNPLEMAMPDSASVVKVIGGIPEYQDMFKVAFPKDAKPVTFDNLAKAIASFERTLISKCRFDFYLNGNVTSLKDEELAGLKTFMDVGCITCHTGTLVGGSIPQKMGLVKAYKNDKDKGRFEVTKNEADKFMFKVASLRNVAITHPYFHDGTVANLTDAVNEMADINLGKTLTPDELNSVIAFLNALTDVNMEKK